MSTNSETEICNMALSFLGTGKRISAMSTDRSSEAEACRTFFPLARGATLRLIPWSFATKIVYLPLVWARRDLWEGDFYVGSCNDFPPSPPCPTPPVPCKPPLPPQTEWCFAYRVPADCLFFRRVLSGVRNDNRQTRIPFREIPDAQGSLILTDMTCAIGEYTFEELTVAGWPPDFVEAMAFRLAAYIAARVTAGDPFKLGPAMVQMYNMSITTASAANANQEQPDQVPESEFTRSRDALSAYYPGDPFFPSPIVRGPFP